MVEISLASAIGRGGRLPSCGQCRRLLAAEQRCCWDGNTARGSARWAREYQWDSLILPDENPDDYDIRGLHQLNSHRGMRLSAAIPVNSVKLCIPVFRSAKL